MTSPTGSASSPSSRKTRRASAWLGQLDRKLPAAGPDHPDRSRRQEQKDFRLSGRSMPNTQVDDRNFEGKPPARPGRSIRNPAGEGRPAPGVTRASPATNRGADPPPGAPQRRRSSASEPGAVLVTEPAEFDDAPGPAATLAAPADAARIARLTALPHRLIINPVSDSIDSVRRARRTRRA